jgi:hypothetical protein
VIKRVNSTGRRRIGSDHITIEVHEGQEHRTFDATIDLNGFEAPDEAAVVLEATCAGSSTIRRYAWGTVGRLLPPDDRALRNLHGENVFFSLKVIDRSEKFGRILGLAENIRPLKGGPKTATGRRGILPVEKADLGAELWRLDFRSEDVFLLVNQKIPGLEEKVRFDASVFPLIYPAIIREVLRRAISEDPTDEDEDSDKWEVRWRKFAQQLHPEGTLVTDDDDEQDQKDWIDEVVAAFCKQHSLGDKFIQAAGSNVAWDETT